MSQEQEGGAPDLDVVGWADARLRAMLKGTPMWGCPEAVELQFLLLAELRDFVSGRPPGRVMDVHGRFVHARFPGHGRRPIFEAVAEDDEVYTKLSAALAGLLTALDAVHD